MSKTFAVVIDGEAVDLHEWVITAQIRKHDGVAAVVHEFSDAEVILSQVVIRYNNADLTTSTIQLSTTPSTTGAWPLLVGDWDWQISKGDETYTIVYGSFRVARDVTH